MFPDESSCWDLISVFLFLPKKQQLLEAFIFVFDLWIMMFLKKQFLKNKKSRARVVASRGGDSFFLFEERHKRIFRFISF
jgi:hypothetical protein